MPGPALESLITQVTSPGHYFQGPRLNLEWQSAHEEQTFWEIFRGHVLDQTQTRLRRTFTAWNVYSVENGQRAAEPLLAVKLDAEAGQIHVTRSIFTRAWEGYNAGGNVYQSRETNKWLRELVGSIHLNQYANLDAIRDELTGLLFRAVIGTSRLPLTSLESPLPAFSLGELMYCTHAAPLPEESVQVTLKSWQELLQKAFRDGQTPLEEAKFCEFLLRATPAEDLDAMARALFNRWQQIGRRAEELPQLLRTVFNEVALSPYTDFVDKTLAVGQIWVENGLLSTADWVDFLNYVLRQNARHLTAYDLITFHHRGANYPDALFLNAALRTYLVLVDRFPELFLSASGESGPQTTTKRLRRRALRQGWLLWHLCKGLPVPEVPTSSGENLRILPAPFVRVPEDQIEQPAKRRRRLFADEELETSLGPGARAVLQESITDLAHPAELEELGMAVFLERPLGIGKHPAEPDRTLLLSYEAYSRSIAGRRLAFLVEMLRLFPDEITRAAVTCPALTGVSVERGQRPGIVSLSDMYRAASDFELLRTTPRAVRDFLRQFDFEQVRQRFRLDFLNPGKRLLIVGEPSRNVLAIFDDRGRRRLELEIDLSEGYRSRAGEEYPARGFRVLHIWDAEASALDLGGEGIRVLPKLGCHEFADQPSSSHSSNPSSRRDAAADTASSKG